MRDLTPPPAVSRPDPKVVLASASPRRADLLRAAGVDFEVRPADVDERLLDDEPPADAARRLAELKARTVDAPPDAWVVAADTLVVVDGRALGKPADAAEAAAMLRRLAGRAHDVVTGVACRQGARLVSDLATTRVWMAPLTDDAIAWYVASGEPLDKAGAYGIQGRASRFVTRIDGSYANVVGLPVDVVVARLAEMGWPAQPDDPSRR